MQAEADFLDPKQPYALRDTGQGLNRMQRCPRVGAAMRDVLHRVQSAEGQWVGSSVVHLGDTNVPNAFTFLDKYTQVSRVLSPIVLVVEGVPKLLRDQPKLGAYVTAAFGSEDGLLKAILGDFFRSGFVRRAAPPRVAARLLSARLRSPLPSPHPPAVKCKLKNNQDGSGADNFFDAGSCIDGRLTSAWEWCSKIDRKPFAPVFRLCSVLGFDGRWEGK